MHLFWTFLLLEQHQQYHIGMDFRLCRKLRCESWYISDVAKTFFQENGAPSQKFDFSKSIIFEEAIYKICYLLFFFQNFTRSLSVTAELSLIQSSPFHYEIDCDTFMGGESLLAEGAASNLKLVLESCISC